MPFLLLSAAASRLLVSLLCVWCPCVRVWFCPFCPALSPPVSTSLFFLVVCVTFRVLFVSGRLSCALSRSVGAPVRCVWVEFVVSLFGRYSVTLVLGGSLPLLCFCFCCSCLGGLLVLGCVLVGPFFCGNCSTSLISHGNLGVHLVALEMNCRQAAGERGH